MLCGRLLPELGGRDSPLDIIGVNYYWTNQWEINNTLKPLDRADPRRAPLRDLIRSVWDRYRATILITETSHAGDMRAAWVLELTEEAEAILDEGIPLEGICLYPITWRA